MNEAYKKYKMILNVFKNATELKDIENIRDDIFDLFPSTAVMYKYNQYNAGHQYDLWDHSAMTVINLSRYNIEDDIIYLAAFLHDIAKPICRVADKKRRVDESGEYDHFHYYGHPVKSAKMVYNMMNEIAKEFAPIFDDKELNTLCWYVYHHDDHISVNHAIRDLNIILNNSMYRKYDKIYKLDITPSIFRHLMYLELADALAHRETGSSWMRERVDVCGFFATDVGIDIYKSYVNNTSKRKIIQISTSHSFNNMIHNKFNEYMKSMR